MSYIIDLATVTDERGSITIAEKVIPFDIKRVYWIYQFGAKRGGHRHKKTMQALVCINGSCEIFINNGNEQKSVMLDCSNRCLILEPDDWHTMECYDKNAVLLVMASEYYDKDDYVYESVDVS